MKPEDMTDKELLEVIKDNGLSLIATEEGGEVIKEARKRGLLKPHPSGMMDGKYRS